MSSPSQSRAAEYDDSDRNARAQMYDTSDDTERPTKKSRASVEPATAGIANGDPNGTNLYQNHYQNRAAQACMRCRKQKLRCLGGQPCARCLKANKECNFGKSGPNATAGITDHGHQKGEQGESSNVVKARLEHLESSVANLLAGLQNFDSGGPQSFDAVPSGSVPTLSNPPLPHVAETCDYGSFSTLPYDTDTLPQMRESPNTQEMGQVRFGNSPEVNFISPYSQSSIHGLTPPTTERKETGGKSRRRKGEEAEERLASATKDTFEPPFRALTYQVSLVWNPLL